MPLYELASALLPYVGAPIFPAYKGGIMSKDGENRLTRVPQDPPARANVLLAAALMGVEPEVMIRDEMRSLAGKMMHHSDREVREIAATLLRCVERLETGR